MYQNGCLGTSTDFLRITARQGQAVFGNENPRFIDLTTSNLPGLANNINSGLRYTEMVHTED